MTTEEAKELGRQAALMDLTPLEEKASQLVGPCFIHIEEPGVYELCQEGTGLLLLRFTEPEQLDAFLQGAEERKQELEEWWGTRLGRWVKVDS